MNVESPAASAFLEVAKAVVIAVVLSIGINTYLLQVVDVRQSSMETTLEEGDRVLLSKIDYRFHPPQRGDIIVFHPPTAACAGSVTACVPFVKRVIAIAGDSVELRDGKVFVNSVALNERYVHSPTSPEGDAIRYPFVVPADRVFVLGDNRTASGDSRAWGAVPYESILGKAYVDFWPLMHAKWLAP